MTVKKQPASHEVLRPNFGQHTPAIDELLKLLSQASNYRSAVGKRVDDLRKRLQEDEERLAHHNRQIESFRSAIRALGGKVPAPEESTNPS